MNTKSLQYAVIINFYMERFRTLYQRQEPKMILSLPTRINNGDCFVMATLVYMTAKAQGLSPVVYSGSHHVWVQEDGLVFDSYFPGGITHEEIKKLQLNDMGNDEPPFYHGGPINGIALLDGYFFNNPDRALWAEYLLNMAGMALPVGLRKCLKLYGRGRYQRRRKDAMKRFIYHLRKTNEKAWLHLGQP